MRTDPLGATSCMSRTQCRFVIEMTPRGGLSYLRIPVMAPPDRVRQPVIGLRRSVQRRIQNNGILSWRYCATSSNVFK